MLKEDNTKLKQIISESKNSIIFLRKLDEECKSISRYGEKLGLAKPDLSMSEKIKIVDEIASSLSFLDEKGKGSNSTSIMPHEQGVLYNKYFNKLYPDSLFNEGLYNLQYYDSLIVFDLLPQRFQNKFTLLLTDGVNITVDLIFVVKLKKENVGYLFKSFRSNYSENLIIPELRYITRKALSELTTADVQSLTSSEISELIINNTYLSKDLKNYATLLKVYVNYIDFPEILEKVIQANLMSEYSDLKSNNVDNRIDAIDRLFVDSSETAFLIILSHWQYENDEIVKDHILKGLKKNN
mgnify:CR=1 FL=1